MCLSTLISLWANSLFAQPVSIELRAKTAHYSVVEASECRGLPASDIAAVRKTNAAYPAAWMGNDSAAVMRLFSADAVLIPHHGDAPVEGEAAIRRHFWPPNASFFQLDAFQMKPAEVAGCADLAYALGRFEIEYTAEADGVRKKYANAGNYVMILRKHGDLWLISRYIWDDPAPRTVTPPVQR